VRKEYLHDGVYAADDGFHIVLFGNANSRENEIFLDHHALSELMRFIERARGVKITTKKSEEEKS
jgi:hypothetical protein